jgi:hypothetical protein
MVVWLLVLGAQSSWGEPPATRPFDAANLAAVGIVRKINENAAICIDPSGYFVTRGNEANLIVLEPGTDRERQVPARRVRGRNDFGGLSLLKVDGLRDLPFIPLDPSLSPGIDVSARLYGIYRAKSGMQRARAIMSLDGIKWAKGHDSFYITGYSGTGHNAFSIYPIALVDESGKCYAVDGGPSEGISYTRALREFFKEPLIAFVPPRITPSPDPCVFEIKILSLASDPPQLKVDLTLDDGSGKERVYQAEPAGPRLWRVPVPHVLTPDHSTTVRYAIALRDDKRAVASEEGEIAVEGLSIREASAINQRLLDKGGRVVIPLGGMAQSCAVGGGGRYILIATDTGRIVIYDAQKRAVAKEISGLPGNVKIAAGATRFLLIQPSERMVQRWNLTTLTRELTVNLPQDWNIQSACMGSASEGPVLIGMYETLAMLDLATMNAIDVKAPSMSGAFFSHAGRASADGRQFGFLHGPHNQGVSLSAATRNGASRFDVHDGFPSFDGSFIFASQGVLSANRVPIEGDFRDLPVRVPAADHPDFMLQCCPHREWVAGPASIRRYSNPTPVVVLPVIPELAWSDREVSSLHLEERTFLLASRGQLAIISPQGDRLVIYPVDLFKGVANGVQVISVAPALAERGKPLSYQIECKSRTALTFSLLGGPDGASVSSKGLVEWAVPPNYAERRASIVISIKPQGGDEVFHTLALDVK